MTQTVLIPHGNVLHRIASEQSAIFQVLPSLYRRVVPFCCFLPDNGEPLEFWATKITSCRILVPVLRAFSVVYPVSIPGMPSSLGITTAAPLVLVTAGASETRPLIGDFSESILKVFRLCSLSIERLPTPPQATGTSAAISRACRWTVDKSLWVKCKSAEG
jgi:hypothetical protein